MCIVYIFPKFISCSGLHTFLPLHIAKPQFTKRISYAYLEPEP